MLRALASDLAQSTHLDEVASVIYKCLGQKISFDTLGLYVRREEHLEPIYFLGAHLSLFNKKAFPDYRRTVRLGCAARTPHCKREHVHRMLL